MGIFSSCNKLHVKWGTGRREASWCNLFASVYIAVISILLHHFMNACRAMLYRTPHPTSQTGDRGSFSAWQVLPTMYLHCVCSLVCIFLSAAANLCNTSDHRNTEVLTKDLVLVGFLALGAVSPLVQLELLNKLPWFFFVKFAKEICSGTETMHVR